MPGSVKLLNFDKIETTCIAGAQSKRNTHLSGFAASGPSGFPLRNTMSNAMKHRTMVPVPSRVLTSPATRRREVKKFGKLHLSFATAYSMH